MKNLPSRIISPSMIRLKRPAKMRRGPTAAKSGPIDSPLQVHRNGTGGTPRIFGSSSNHDATGKVAPNCQDLHVRMPAYAAFVLTDEGWRRVAGTPTAD